MATVSGVYQSYRLMRPFIQHIESYKPTDGDFVSYVMKQARLAFATREEHDSPPNFIETEKDARIYRNYQEMAAVSLMFKAIITHVFPNVEVQEVRSLLQQFILFGTERGWNTPYLVIMIGKAVREASPDFAVQMDSPLSLNSTLPTDHN